MDFLVTPVSNCADYLFHNERWLGVSNLDGFTLELSIQQRSDKCVGVNQGLSLWVLNDQALFRTHKPYPGAASSDPKCRGLLPTLALVPDKARKRDG